jgi:hypothetical protein
VVGDWRANRIHRRESACSSPGSALWARSNSPIGSSWPPLNIGWDGRREEFAAFYVRRAQSGVGLVIAPQATPGELSDRDTPGFGLGFRDLISERKAVGARIAMQLFPGSEDADEVGADRLESLPGRFARAASTQSFLRFLHFPSGYETGRKADEMTRG